VWLELILHAGLKQSIWGLGEAEFSKAPCYRIHTLGGLVLNQ
jgi:hypothetical protein